jgi:hypothetical protein
MLTSRLRRLLASSALAAASWTIAGPAAAGTSWCWTSLGGCGVQIFVAPNNVPAILGCDSHVRIPVTDIECFYVNGSEVCQTNEHDFLDDGGPFQVMTISRNGEVFGIDFDGALWVQNAGSAAGIGYQAGYGWRLDDNPQDQPPGGCVYTLGSSVNPEGPPQGSFLMGSVCGNNDLWSVDLVSHRSSEIGFAGGGPQVAGFSGPLNGWQTPWLATPDGYVYAFDGAYWEDQPGWGFVQAITDHYMLAFDGNVYHWNDNLPSEWSGQFVPGDWEGPVAGPPPGATLAQIAFADASYMTNGDSANYTAGPSTLWAIDTAGSIWEGYACSQPR